ncbi:unnamed protein product [Rhizophagus irregularis]|nr:unnamed protein product [Rhizophagus irregularis]
MASSRYYDDFTLNEDENEKTNESLEDFDMTVLPIESVIGSELENFNVSKYPLLTQPVELVSSNTTDRTVRKRIFTCEYTGKYKPKKLKPIDQQRNKEYKKMDCKWYINLSKPESNNFVCITFIQSEHNHELLADNIRFAAKFQRNLLQLLFSNQIFFTQDLSNAIQKIKREKQISSSDASVLLKFLLKQQKEEPIMFVQPLINVDSDRLCGIFWMTANQIDLWSRYSDVILHDNTSRTNKYNYPLSLFILVDNNGKSCLEIQAFLNDEKQESYERILKNT